MCFNLYLSVTLASWRCVPCVTTSSTLAFTSLSEEVPDLPLKQQKLLTKSPSELMTFFFLTLTLEIADVYVERLGSISDVFEQDLRPIVMEHSDKLKAPCLLR